MLLSSLQLIATVSFKKVGCYELLELEVLTLEEILFSSLCFECAL